MSHHHTYYVTSSHVKVRAPKAHSTIDKRQVEKKTINDKLKKKNYQRVSCDGRELMGHRHLARFGLEPLQIHQRLQIHTHTHTHTHTHARTHTHAHTHTRTHTHTIHTGARAQTHTHTSTRVRCTLCRQISEHTHTYTHTLSLSLSLSP